LGLAIADVRHSAVHNVVQVVIISPDPLSLTRLLGNCLPWTNTVDSIALSWGPVRVIESGEVPSLLVVTRALPSRVGGHEWVWASTSGDDTTWTTTVDSLDGHDNWLCWVNWETCGVGS